MIDARLAQLQEQLVARYEQIRRQLTQRLGSDEFAREVLQETYLHLSRPAKIGIVGSPMQYLLTVATNIAGMRFRREKGWVSLDDVDQAIELVDESPDPAQSTEARSDLAALQRAFDELTSRRRYILFAARVDRVRLGDIAAMLGVSRRLVEMELKHALDHCALRLDRDRTGRSGSAGRDASDTERDGKMQGISGQTWNGSAANDHAA